MDPMGVLLVCRLQPRWSVFIHVSAYHMGFFGYIYIDESKSGF
jgi:hypothetical protein